MRKSVLRRLALEGLEPRALLAVLPAVTVTSQVDISNTPANGHETAPSIAVDPTNPQKLVAVWTRDTPNTNINSGQTSVFVEGAYSTNAGQSWTALSGTLGNTRTDFDQSQANGARFFAQVTDAGVAFDRNNQFYVLSSPHSADYGAGEILLQKFDFSGSVPTQVFTNQTVYQWTQDPAFRPVLAVDSNLDIFTDPDVPGYIQTDSFTGNVYVAWSTNNVAPDPVPTNFNPNVIKIIASSDAVTATNLTPPTFTTQQYVNDSRNIGLDRNATPRLAISQGRPIDTAVYGPGDQGVPGGQVTIVWDDTSTRTGDNPPIDRIVSDRIRNGGTGALVPGTTGPVLDAIDPGGGAAHNARINDFTADVNITDPDFVSLSDLDVTIDLTHNSIAEIRIELIPPTGSGLPTITLLNNRTNAAGTVNTNTGASGANLGTTTSGIRLGTVFDDDAPRSIFNNAGGGASTGHFRPEFGSLASYDGATPTTGLNGTWTLRITDFRASGTPNPAPRLNDWSLNFTSGLTDNFDTQVATTLVRGAVNANAAPLLPAAAPSLGIAPAPVIASDNTLGAFSPHQGRLYVAYVSRPTGTGVPADNTDISLVFSDNGGLSWQTGDVKVNDDLAATDGFSESDAISGRPQFLPAVAVDPATGTLVVTFLDARDDAARARVATYIATSIDGGTTFSPQTFANAAEVATDAITGQTRIRGPLPENQSSGNTTRSPSGFGHRQDVAVANGLIFPAWAGNNNGGTDGNRRLDIFTAQVTVANGPRIVDSTMGPVGEVGDTVNTTRAADGTPQASNFLITFDRPVDPATFDATDVQLVYRNPAGMTTDLTATAGITVTPVPISDPDNPNSRFGFTTFNVGFTPQSGIGTYSYSVGPDIQDRIRSTFVPGLFTSTDVPLRIPPSGTGGSGVPAQDRTLSNLTVSGIDAARVIADLNVNLTLNHTFDGDLDIFLIAPNGMRVELSTNNGGGGNNYTGTIFDDEAATAITAGFPPFAGSFRPEGSLAVLDGLNPNGLWQLEITDEVGSDIGTLLSWSLDIQLDVAQSGIRPGNPMDQDADSAAGEPVDDAYATPRPLLGGTFAAGPYDPETLPLVVPGPHVVGTSVPSATAPAPVQFSATSDQVNRPIPDATLAGPGMQTATINVTGLPRAVSDLDVRVSVTHARVGDLILALIAPDGTVVTLAQNRGGGGANYTTTTFDDEAAAPITAGSPPFTGSFRPQGSLAVLDGLNPNGTWTLRVTDTAVGVAGTLADFTLTIVTDNAPTTDNLVLNDTVNALDVTFDRDMDPSSFSAASILRIQGPAGLIVPAAGQQFTFTPVAGSLRTFRIGFPPSAVQFLSGTYTVSFGPGLRDARGNPLDRDLDAGVDVLFSRGTTTTPLVAVSTDTPAAIPDAPDTVTPGVLVSTITVTDTFPIQGLVTLPDQFDPVTGLPAQVGGITVQVNIQHPGDPDLQASLIYHPGLPDEVRIPLFANIGTAGNQANFTNTVFDDAATTPIQNGGPPFNGRFNPMQSLLTALAGRSSAGDYTLEIRDTNPTRTGTLLNWSLTFRRPLANTGLGEPVVDDAAASFRIFTTDPTNRLASSTWTAVGPASINGNGNSGRIGGLAVDPSDPSGNTVYVGGASGGVWKTTNFLTTDPNGPTYIPLTDFGPTFAINIGGLAVFGRNNDPNQSIVFAATGEGDTGTVGVGFLRSLDGGATWTLLDSTNNNLPFAQRDHIFARRTTSFKVVVDPRLTLSGDVIVYAALSGNDAVAGIWRSRDTGRTWERLLAGQATDVVLDPNSGTGVAGGNLQIVYAAIRGQGVFFSPNQGNVFNLMTGGVGNPLIRDADRTNAQVNPVPPPETPNGPKGRIVLAKPFLTGNAAQDLIYQGWLYAAVATPDSRFDGLYVTKDFGQNWTKLRIPTIPPSVTGGVAAVRATPTNDLNQPDYDVGGGPAGTGLPAQLNYDISLGIDPTNPNVLYLGGTTNGQPSGFIRIDATLAADAHALVPFDNNRPDGGRTRIGSNGATGNAAPPLTVDDPINLPTPRVVGDATQRQYYNLIRNPNAPFVAGATIVVRNSLQFNNNGGDVLWMPFDFGVTDQHRIVTFVDPVTGHARLIIGDDQGVHTAVDDNGSFVTSLGTQPVPFGPRSGNLQITQFYYGASQPSSSLLNGQIRSLLYGQAQDDGFPRSDPDILNNGNLTWFGGLGDGTGVATDQQGLGTVYQYNWPCCGGNRTDFFQVDGVGRTFGLLQQSNPGPTPDPQWPNLGGSNFAVNPINGNQIIMSSPISGRFFGTETRGLFWSVIGEPTALDSTYVQAPAYGAPDPFGPGGIGNLNNFLYAGTTGGRIFVTQTGGGGTGNQWTNISAGLDGSALQAIVTNPTRGSHEAYAVTARGVFHNPNTVSVSSGPFAGPAQPWTNITGNLFQVMHQIFGDPALVEAQAASLTSIVADYRYVIPNATGTGTHPLLYVAGQAGVYRSVDNGTTWTLFPNVAFDGSPRDGGFFPVADVRDLDLAIGKIDATTGRAVAVPGDPNILLATTFGRGSFAIRLAPIVFPNTAQQPNLLTLDPSTDTGSSATDRVTNDATPIVVGTSQQSAFGNVVRITLFDVTNPANPVFIGGFDPANPVVTDVAANRTDANGQFRVQVNVPLPNGVRTIGVQATDQSGTRGNIATLTIVVDTLAPASIGAPDLQATSDTGISNTDNLTNFNNSTATNAPVFDVVVPPIPPPAGETVATVQLFRAPVVGGVVGTPVLVNTLNNRTSGTVAIADINQSNPTLQTRGPAIPDGTYRYTARLIDQAGNVGAMGPSLTVVIETVAPVAGPPDLIDADDAGRPRPPRDTDDITNVELPTFQGVVEPRARVELFVNGSPGGAVRADAAGNYSITTVAPLREGRNSIQVRETDIAGNVGPFSSALVVTLDTVAPPPITPDLASASDTGIPRPPADTDDTTIDTTPTFVGTAEPNALVQIFAQLVAAPGQPDNPIVLVGEAVANATTGAYAVTVGQYVQPLPAVTVPSLADGSYLITALQIDIAGNISRTQVFGNSGAIVIDGTDANDHGGRDPVTGANIEGWFYMQQVLENIQPNVTNGNRLLLSVGANPAELSSGIGFGSASAIASAFAQSPLPGLGWTIAFVEGPADIETLLSGQAAPARNQTNQIIAGGVRLADAGILYFPTANNASGDLSSFSFGSGGQQFPGGELGAVNRHGIDISNFVNGGGGLFAQAESPFSFGGTVVEPFGWLTSIFPDIVAIDQSQGAFDIQITPEGMQAFPNLTPGDLSVGPWHNYFGGLPGPDGIVGTGDDDFTPLAPAVTDRDFSDPNIRRTLILTTTGGVVSEPLVVTIDSSLPPRPTGLDLVDTSDSFFRVIDTTGTHVVGSNTDNYTNPTLTNPNRLSQLTFTVGAIEGGASVALLRNGSTVQSVTAPGSGLQTLTLIDPGPIPAGLHSYQVAQRDVAGNLSAFSAPLPVRVDTSVPAVPSVPRLLPADDSGVLGDNMTNVPQPRLTGSVALATGEPLPTIHLIDANGQIVGEGVASANGTYTVRLTTSFTSGIPFTVRARAVDQAGNASVPSANFNLTIDTRIPPTPTLALSPLDDSGIPGDNITNIRQPNLIGTVGPTNQTLLIDLLLVSPSGTRTVLVSGRPVLTDGSFQVRVPSALADGTYRFQVRAYDAAGNESFSDSNPVTAGAQPLQLTIDTTAPTAVPSLGLDPASNTGIRTDTRTSTRRPFLVGSIGSSPEPGARLEVIDAAGNVLNLPAATVIQSNGSFRTQLASDLVNGTIALRARMRDAAGNVGPPGPTLTLTIITTEGDYDADGRADLAVFQRGTTAVPLAGQWSIARSTLGNQVRLFGGRDDTPVQADFDGDGINDLVVFRPATSTWYIQGSRGVARDLQFGPAGVSQPVPADYDGDGITDVAVYVASTSPTAASTWFILNSRDGVGRAVPFGGAGFVPVPADYDGDGRADIAAYLPSTNTVSSSRWFIQGTSSAGRDVAFGGAGHIPVPADYDGDNRADIATYLPSTNTVNSSRWFIQGTSSAGRDVAFGGASHIPVPRDYDGDGEVDIATFEPASAQWFLQRTAAGPALVTFGAPGNVPVPAPLSFRQAPVRSSAAPAAPGAAVTAVAVDLDLAQTAAHFAAGSMRRRRALWGNRPVVSLRD